MASIASTSHFPCKTCQKFVNNSLSGPKSSPFAANRVNFSLLSRDKSTRTKRDLAVCVVSDDEWGPEKDPVAPGVAVLEEASPKEPTEPKEVDVLKRQLVDSFYGTNRGLNANSETRAEIVELITQLEAKNPTPAPTQALTLLNGKWILAYTSSLNLFPLLSTGASFSLAKVDEISQTIDSNNYTVQNSVRFSGPLTITSISTNAKFEIRSPKLVQIKFEEGIIGTPQLTDSIEVPENVEVLGQKIDLTPFRGLLTSVQDTASSLVKTFSRGPPLKFPIFTTKAGSWLLTTYLDDELRISRSDGGGIFVLIKESCPLLTLTE